MILVDRRIREAIKKGELGDDFDEEYVQPASYDLRIGTNVYSPHSKNPDKPYDLSSNGGHYRLGPYDLVMLQTYEFLRMPKNLVGRIGLQSRHARKGLVASVGPQVDPGFAGRLFVTLQNSTNASQLIQFKETFLTIEYTQLEEQPDDTYQGPYQNRREIGADVLADLLRLEGLSLNQMQGQFSELALHVKEWERLAGRFDEFLRMMGETAKQAQELQNLVVQLASDRVSEDRIVEARRLSPKEAQKQVMEFFQQHAGQDVYYSDIMEALNLDSATVIAACKSLQENKLIEPKNNADQN
ncbi:MAG TPA: hypothetical protein VJ783_24010 [Pirellulales bacterium]|nr:hypothetical protein [Pirellulales bacterium]